MNFTYLTNENHPVEVLVFSMDPRVVEEFLALDHEVWTIGEAFLDGLKRIPFLSKEVWLDDSKPGQVTLVFVWDEMCDWESVDRADVQQRLGAEFAARFPHEVRLVAAPHEDSGRRIHRVSRFERKDHT